MTGDNAAVVKCIADELKIPFYGCFAHVLNLIVTSSLVLLKLDNDDDDCVLKKCRSLVSLFSHSTILSENLLVAQKEFCNDKKPVYLMQDVKTRYI